MNPVFNCGRYDIANERLASHREVTIRSPDGPTPALGDPFTIVHGLGSHDVVVVDVDMLNGRGWIARCSQVGPA